MYFSFMRERERDMLPQLKVCPLFYSEQIDRRSRDLLNTACLLIIHLNWIKPLQVTNSKTSGLLQSYLNIHCKNKIQITSKLCKKNYLTSILSCQTILFRCHCKSSMHRIPCRFNFLINRILITLKGVCHRDILQF